MNTHRLCKLTETHYNPGQVLKQRTRPCLPRLTQAVHLLHCGPCWHPPHLAPRIPRKVSQPHEINIAAYSGTHQSHSGQNNRSQTLLAEKLRHQQRRQCDQGLPLWDSFPPCLHRGLSALRALPYLSTPGPSLARRAFSSCAQAFPEYGTKLEDYGKVGAKGKTRPSPIIDTSTRQAKGKNNSKGRRQQNWQDRDPDQTWNPSNKWPDGSNDSQPGTYSRQRPNLPSWLRSLLPPPPCVPWWFRSWRSPFVISLFAAAPDYPFQSWFPFSVLGCSWLLPCLWACSFPIKAHNRVQVTHIFRSQEFQYPKALSGAARPLGRRSAPRAALGGLKK